MTHRLRIQCPYCFGNIDEVVEGMDVMKVHKDFNTNCPFLKHKQKSKNNKRKQNKAKEEDIWSIEHALKPPLELLSPLKQPSVTYSKRRKTRSLLQLPAESEVAFSNIVSTRNPSYSTKKHVIIVHPEPTAPSSSLSNFIKDQDIVGLSSSFDEDVQIIDNGCRVIEEFDDKEDMSNWDDDEASCAKKSVTEDMDVEEVKEIIEKKTRLFDAKSRTSKQVDVKHKPKGLIERLETKQDITRIFKKKGGEKDAKSKSRESSAVKTSKALSFFTSGSEVPLITKGKSRSFEETTSSTVKRPLSLSRRKKEQDSTAVKSVYFGKIPDQKAEADHFKDAEFITVMFKETGLNSCVQIQTIYDKKGDSTVITHHYTD
ncbi:hypothetical protein K501DRAFT_31099 [Backusella circina FSU 941]|nr:hypothetical protein K501DRAFT_31099 [Backusella circina FSU 941]